MAINGRTDMASEIHRRICDSERVTELPGVQAREEELGGFPVTEVQILDRRGEERLGKPAGRYLTLELPKARLSEDFSDAVSVLARLIRRCLPADVENVLLVALGNPDITPDAIGPLCAGHLLVTRHLKQHGVPGAEDLCSTSLCRPGVLGSSGIESAAQIRALCELLRPDLVIAVDALAGSDLDLLCRTVQICDSGIAPGSGVGNARDAIDRESLGLPVVAIGVPTVIDASALSDEPGLAGMFVTPRSIDAQVRACGKLIGYGIDLALHPGLRLEDLQRILED